jgi:hypothetical protein
LGCSSFTIGSDGSNECGTHRIAHSYDIVSEVELGVDVRAFWVERLLGMREHLLNHLGDRCIALYHTDILWKIGSSIQTEVLEQVV